MWHGLETNRLYKLAIVVIFYKENPSYSSTITSDQPSYFINHCYLSLSISSNHFQPHQITSGFIKSLPTSSNHFQPHQITSSNIKTVPSSNMPPPLPLSSSNMPSPLPPDLSPTAKKKKRRKQLIPPSSQPTNV